MFVGARGLCLGLIRAAGSHGDRRTFIVVHGSPQNRATSGAACLAYRLEVSNYPFGSSCSPLRIGASSARFGARWWLGTSGSMVPLHWRCAPPRWQSGRGRWSLNRRSSSIRLGLNVGIAVQADENWALIFDRVVGGPCWSWSIWSVGLGSKGSGGVPVRVRLVLIWPVEIQSGGSGCSLPLHSWLFCLWAPGNLMNQPAVLLRYSCVWKKLYLGPWPFWNLTPGPVNQENSKNNIVNTF
jgi:hypothetical protein